MQAACSTRHCSIADGYRYMGDSMPDSGGGEVAWSTVISRHHQFLLDHMDPDFGLLDKLLGKRMISFGQKNVIRAETTVEKRNEKLLEIVVSLNQCHRLIDALRSSNQTHVVNYLESDAKHSTGDDWPLGEREDEILIFNFEKLVDLIESNDLVNKLNSCCVINSRQMEFIRRKSTTHEQNEALLEILRRRSIRDYKNTIRCFEETNQPHIARLLQDGGGIISFHVNTNGDPDTEREIADKITDMLGNRSVEECSRILEMVQVNVIAAKPGGSVILYVYLQTIEHLNLFKVALQSRLLMDSVRMLFDKIALSSKNVAALDITVEEVEFKRFKEIFRAETNEDISTVTPNEDLKEPITKDEITETGNDNSQISHYATIHINQVPFEILDIILQKSYLSYIRHTGLTSPLQVEDHEMITRLGSVNFIWFKRITNRKLKTTIWRKLCGFYESKTKTHAVVRNNQQYLETCFQGQNLRTTSLKSADCVTDVQAAIVKRGKHLMFIPNKTESKSLNISLDILEIFKSLDYQRRSQFIHHLRRVTRKSVDRVFESGDVAVFIRAKSWRGAENLTKTVFKKLSDLNDRWKHKPPSLNQILLKLREGRMEILEAFLDRDIVCPIRYRPMNDLGSLQSVGTMEVLRELFTEFVSEIGGGELKLDADFESFRKTTVKFSTVVSFATKLHFKEVENVEILGITKLRHKICILCRPSEVSPQFGHLVCVFDDRENFSFLQKTNFEEFKTPADIGASERNNCLYVNDYDALCVWKITLERGWNEQMQHSIMKWLETGEDFRPLTLTVSSDDQLLMVSGYQGTDTLRIYGSDARNLLSIRLQDEIEWPLHAVETWDGNFIILHKLREKSKDTEENSRRQWVISESSRDGKTVARRFLPENKEQSLNYPHYLSCGPGGHVLLCDRRNHRVVQLDSDLKWDGILTPTDEEKKRRGGRKVLREPRRLFHDAENANLFVGGGKAREGVSVYTLTKK